MWSLYYLTQQKHVRYYSPFNRIVWKTTNGGRNYLKQQKSVEFLLFQSQYSSSGPPLAHLHVSLADDPNSKLAALATFELTLMKSTASC